VKIFILTDLEGVAGVYTFEDYVVVEGRCYEKARRFLTNEVNACVQGAFEAGATEILVFDGHGVGGINIEAVDPRVRMLQPSAEFLIDDSYQAMMVVGQHSKAATAKGHLCHSFSYTEMIDLWLNGISMGELGLRMALAGSFGVPTIFVSGDSAACEEALALVGEIITAPVKEGLGRQAAIHLPPPRAAELIRRRAVEAVRNRDRIPPLGIQPPFELKIRYLDTGIIDRMAPVAGIERLDAQTIHVIGDDLNQVCKTWIYAGM